MGHLKRVADHSEKNKVSSAAASSLDQIMTMEINYGTLVLIPDGAKESSFGVRAHVGEDIRRQHD